MEKVAAITFHKDKSYGSVDFYATKVEINGTAFAFYATFGKDEYKEKTALICELLQRHIDFRAYDDDTVVVLGNVSQIEVIAWYE